MELDTRSCRNHTLLMIQSIRANDSSRTDQTEASIEHAVSSLHIVLKQMTIVIEMSNYDVVQSESHSSLTVPIESIGRKEQESIGY